LNRFVTYEMKHDAREDAVDCKIDASLHALKAAQPESHEDGFLKTAKSLGSVVAHEHVLLPLAVHFVGIQY
jgi:hypothetical protein